MTEGDILAPILDSRYAEIADEVIHNIVLRAYFEAYTADFASAMAKVRPYLEGHPERTVREALELMRADKTAAQAATNQPAPAGATKE